MAILLTLGRSYATPYRDAFAAIDPTLDVRAWPEIGEASDIECLVTWQVRDDVCSRLPNLKLIASAGAGVDGILRAVDLPTHVPIMRIVDAHLTAGMTQYVLAVTLRHLRELPRFEAQQRQGVWKREHVFDQRQVTIGVMGFGALGQDVGRAFAALQFPVVAWSRRAHPQPGIRSFAGSDDFERFLRASNVLICLLPLTPDTRGILNRATLEQLPRGAYVVNAARGGHLIDDDLIALLDAGHLAGAALDVFHDEPLPAGHPFWRHPKIFLTPHVAADPDPVRGARAILENLERVRQGLAPLHAVDRTARY